MTAAVTLLVSTGRASKRPRYHPTTPAPAPAPTAPVFLLGGPKADPTGDGRAGGTGGGRGVEGGGLEEMRWVRKWDHGEGLGPRRLRRTGRRRKPPARKAPAVAMAAAAAAAAAAFLDDRRLRSGFIWEEGKAEVRATRQSLSVALARKAEMSSRKGEPIGIPLTKMMLAFY
jgi:hypothetical protein